MATYGKVVGGGSGSTLTVTAASVTSMLIDVSAYGDGLYQYEFTGTLTAAAKKIKIQLNGSDPASCQGNSILWAAAGTVTAAATETTAVVLVEPAESSTSSVRVAGTFSSRSGQISGIDSKWVGAGTQNWSGTASEFYTPAATLTQVVLVSTVASGIATGSFWVRKVA